MHRPIDRYRPIGASLGTTVPIIGRVVCVLGHMKRRHRRLEKRPSLTSLDCEQGYDEDCDTPSFPQFMPGTIHWLIRTRPFHSVLLSSLLNESVFSFLRHCRQRDTARICCWAPPCSNRSISPDRRAHSSKPTSDGTDRRKYGRTDGQRDRRTPDRYIDPSPTYWDHDKICTIQLSK